MKNEKCWSGAEVLCDEGIRGKRWLMNEAFCKITY